MCVLTTTGQVKPVETLGGVLEFPSRELKAQSDRKSAKKGQWLRGSIHLPGWPFVTCATTLLKQKIVPDLAAAVDLIHTVSPVNPPAALLDVA
jgi:hypothetical protein